MIVTLTFKTPDVTEHSELDQLCEEDRKAAEAVVAKWVKWGEYVTIKIDTDANTATVQPAR